MRLATSFAAVASLLVFGAAASAQEIVTYYSPSPTVTAYSPVVSPAPVVTYSPPVVVQRPVYAAPVVAYRPAAPVVAYSPAAPVVTYSPAVTTYAAPVYVGRPVVARTKYYVAGQPVRNFFKAITP